MRVLIIIALVLLSVAVGGALARSSSSSDSASVRDLRTGFELRKGSAWTSLREERSFLAKLDAASPRVVVSRIGRSVQGRPIRLVRVGPPRTRRQIAAGRSVLFVCTQHGDEPAGREACLQRARDHAGSTSPATVLLIPTANPDGFAATERHNGDGVDMNRDHLELATPEARAVAAVIRDYKPDLLGDLHEYSASGAAKVLFADADRLHLNVDPEIRRLTDRLVDAYAVPAVTRAGFGTGFYTSGADEVDENVLRQMSALRHVPSLLIETPRRGTQSPRRRVRGQSVAMAALMSMARRDGAQVASATSAARRRAVAEGAAGDRRFYYTSPSDSTTTPVCGYRLTRAEFRRVEGRLALHGVAATASGGDWLVSAAQPGQPVVGLLLDRRAPRNLTRAEPVAC